MPTVECLTHITATNSKGDRVTAAAEEIVDLCAEDAASLIKAKAVKAVAADAKPDKK